MKRADEAPLKLHNAGAILSDYRVMGNKLWSRFNGDAGMEGAIGYYRGLVRSYRTAGHHPGLVKELDSTVTMLEAEVGHQGVWPLPRWDRLEAGIDASPV